MFKFKKIEATNFMSLGHVELELDNLGLVLIEGINKSNNTFDSNGAGKSSLTTAITYALYGYTPYGLKSDDVVNRQIGKNMSVILNFEVDGVPYRVERYRKHKANKNKVKLFREDKEITGKSAKNTEEMIQGLFGIDYSTYMNSIVQGQGNTEVFTKATDKGKKDILENITNIAIYKKAQEVAKEKAQLENAKENDIISQIDKIKQSKENLDSLDEADERNYSHTRKMIEDTQARIQSQEKELEAFKGQLDVNTLEEEKRSYEKVEQPHSNMEVTEKEKELKEQIAQAKEQGNDILLQIRTMESTIQQKKTSQSQLDTQTECPYCGSPLDASHAEKEFNRLEKEINESVSIVESTKNMYNTQFITMLNTMQDTLGSLEQERLERYQESQREYNEAQRRIGDINNQIMCYQMQIDNMNNQLQGAKNNLATLEAVPKPVPRDKERKDIEDNLQQLNIEFLAISDKKAQYEEAVKVFSNTGVRSVVLDLVTPYLNERANKYLATLTGSDIEIRFTTQVQNKDGSLADKFDVQILNASGGETYKSNSEGEKKRIDLAISFAIQDLVLSKTNMKTNLAIYDECFESLDEVGCENVITLLKERQKEIGTIFVITHIEHLKALFENVITVEKVDGVSKIKI